MNSDGLTLHELGKAIYDAFVMPGEFVLSLLLAHAPSLAFWLGIDADDVLLPVLVSLLIWLLLLLVIWMLARGAARYVSAMIRTLGFRTLDRLRGIKTRLVCDLRRLIPRRRSKNADATSEVEFDELDLAILRTSAARGQTIAMSARELAAKLTVRPATLRSSLKKLRKLKMLEYVISATDGFGNYRLTRSGAAYVIMSRRQRRGP